MDYDELLGKGGDVEMNDGSKTNQNKGEDFDKKLW